MALRVLIVGVVLLAGESAAAEGTTVPSVGGWDSVLQVSYALFFVLALIIGGSWLMRRVGHFGNTVGRLMRVVSVLSVGSRERVVLVELGGRQLLLGVAPGRVSMLHVLDESLVVEMNKDTRSGFKELLASLSGQNSGARR